MKTCTACKKEKPLGEFYRATRFKDGLMYTCKPCARTAAKAWRESHRDRDNEYARQYRLRNLEKVKAYQKNYCKENRAKIRETERAYYRKNKEKLDRRSKTRFLRVLYNLPIEKYEEMFKQQNGACAICGEQNFEGRRLAVDHNHQTGTVRALLCGRCNTGLGWFKEDVSLLVEAAAYLEKHNSKESV